jgi:hypothetical protein
VLEDVHRVNEVETFRRDLVQPGVHAEPGLCEPRPQFGSGSTQLTRYPLTAKGRASTPVPAPKSRIASSGRTREVTRSNRKVL